MTEKGTCLNCKDRMVKIDEEGHVYSCHTTCERYLNSVKKETKEIDPYVGYIKNSVARACKIRDRHKRR